MTKKTTDYVIPDGSKWSAPPCPGAMGSKPNLTNIQAQIEENNNAARENRKVRALAIPCPFCADYHAEMQPEVKDLVGGEVTEDFKEDTPAPVREIVTDPEVIEVAIEASKAIPVEGTEDEEDGDDGLDELFGDKSDKKSGTKSTKSDSGSKDSSSSSR